MIFTHAARACVVLLMLATGCYHGTAQPVSAKDAGQGPGWLLVKDIRLIPQTGNPDCGAAALAMILQHWSVPVSRALIWRSVPVAPGHGITGGALRDFTVRQGLRAFLFDDGELSDLINEVRMNRPVLVGLVQRYGNQNLSHFEVVAGINPTTRRVLLLDPAHGLREDGFDGFSAEWAAAGRPTLVIVPS